MTSLRAAVPIFAPLFLALCAGAVETAVPQNVPPLFDLAGWIPKDPAEWREGRRAAIK